MKHPMDRLAKLEEKYGSYSEVVLERCSLDVYTHYLDSRENKPQKENVVKFRKLERVLRGMDNYIWMSMGYEQGYKEAKRELERKQEIDSKE